MTNVSMDNFEKLITALNDSEVEIIIRKKPKVEQTLQDQILDYLRIEDGKTGEESREHIASLRGVDPAPIANEVAWALVELQNSTRKRGPYIDKMGPVVKKDERYYLNPDYKSVG